MLEDNILDKKLMAYINEKSFTRKKNVNLEIKKIIKFFGKHFTKGKEAEAIKVGHLIADVLDQPKDAATIERVKQEVKVLTDAFRVYE